MKAPSSFQAFRRRWKKRREHCPSPTTPSPVVIFLFTVSLRRPHDLNAWTGVTHKRFRGVARIFQRVGHRGYSPDCHVDLHGLICTIAVWRPRWRPILTEGKSRWRKYFTKKQILKKVGYSTMAFTAKLLSWRFRHLNIVGCLLKRRHTKGGHGHPRTPPSYTPAAGLILRLNSCPVKQPRSPQMIWHITDV